MFPEVEPDCTWSAYQDAVASAEGDRFQVLASLGGPAGERPAAEVLVDLLVSRDDATLTFESSPEVRAAAAEALLELRSPTGVLELARYLREHWFYEGETEAITDAVAKLHRIQLRPWSGLDGLELALALHEHLFGERPAPGAALPREDLQAVRILLWSVKDQVAFELPGRLRTLEDLGEECLGLGL